MQSVKIEVQNQDLIAAYYLLAEKIFRLGDIDAVLIGKRHSRSAMVMPALVSDPSCLEGIDPLAPAFALNAAKLVAALTRKPSGRRLALFLRPCEIRAVVELVKLNQAAMEEVVIIGSDCLGAMPNTAYLKYVGSDPAAATRTFYQAILNDASRKVPDDFELAAACRACEHPLAEGADVAVLLYGVDTQHQLMLQAQSAKGEALLAALNFQPVAVPEARANVVAEVLQKRAVFRDRMFSETREKVADLEKLSAFLANCVNCYNCRVACPVCYCRECVFTTAVFSHEPLQYLGWSERKGAVKLPADTFFYHLTRLAHMSTACVGCGQCSNACPNDIPVMELFRTIAYQTQAAFEYCAGMNPDQKPPLTEFKEKEFEEIVGLK